MPNFEISNPYPIPEELIDKELRQVLNWVPLAFTEDNQTHIGKVAKQTGTPIRAIPPELVATTVLKLNSNLTF